MHGTTIDQLLARNSGGQHVASEDTVDGFATILAGGHSKTESVHSRADGRNFPVQLISNAVLDPGGTPIGVVTSCEDISDRKRAESELEENRRQLRGLALHLESLRDKERTQIAHEIHNDLGAALTVLKINLTLIESELARLESDQLERAHRMSEDIDAMIDLIRSISRQLRPFLLDDVGLIAAVEALVDDLKRKTDITFELDLPPTEPTLKPEEKETLFRTFQEGTTNSLRHANADRIRARLQVAADRIILEITDDGKGLKADPLKSHSAFGLLGLQERVRSLDGEMLVGPSDTGPGTTLRVTLPQKQGGRE
jgi:signal transduction histidine kinase